MPLTGRTTSHTLNLLLLLPLPLPLLLLPLLLLPLCVLHAQDDTNIHMVMELCEGGALLERIESGLYSEAYISKVVRSILRFIAQCHAKVRAQQVVCGGSGMHCQTCVDTVIALRGLSVC
jgi:serine/threonine protein kinase